MINTTLNVDMGPFLNFSVNNRFSLTISQNVNRLTVNRLIDWITSHCPPSNSFELASRVLRAIDSIHEWMSSNRLSLNTGKTQFIWLGMKHSLAKRDTDRLHSLLPSLTELTSVRNLGFVIDQELVMKDHITKLPVVLLPASPNTHGSALAHIISHPNSGPCFHLHASRFCQQPSLWDKCLPPRPSPIGPQLCCTFDPQNWQIRSDLGCDSTWPSLASDSVSYSIQTKLHNE